jgi:teichuronic acid biosynthesis glycosyltransferase TuaC
MKILSLSSVYPNPAEPGLGLFVRSRLQHMAASAEIKAIAPIPLVDYSNPRGKLFLSRTFPVVRQDGPIEVFHPRWLFPPTGTPLNVVCQFARLLPLVRQIRKTFPFDLIDAHFGYPEGATAGLLAAAFHVPYTITLRGSETMFADYRYRRKAIRWALRRAGHVIAVAEDLRAFAIREGVAPERASTVPNGIDAAIFHPRDSRQMRLRHGLPLDRKSILSAGELIEAKGHHLVIQALKSLLGRGRDVELLIVGSTARGGPRYEDRLHQCVASLGLAGRVRFIGWVDRNGLAELLSAVDLFCLASFTEGWPNVVNEALACGAPVVASRVGGVPAMLPSEQYGIAVPPKDVAALTAALERGLDKQWDRSAISTWGRSRTWADVAREVIDIQRTLAGADSAAVASVISDCGTAP